MDKKFTPITGSIRDLSGFDVQTSIYVKPAGAVYQMNRVLLMSPFNDIIWDNTWRRIIQNERRKAQDFLQEQVTRLRLELGLPLT